MEAHTPHLCGSTHTQVADTHHTHRRGLPTQVMEPHTTHRRGLLHPQIMETHHALPWINAYTNHGITHRMLDVGYRTENSDKSFKKKKNVMCRIEKTSIFRQSSRSHDTNENAHQGDRRHSAEEHTHTSMALSVLRRAAMAVSKVCRSPCSFSGTS